MGERRPPLWEEVKIMPAVAAKVTVIPAKKNSIPLSPSGAQVQKLRVAAYARHHEWLWAKEF